jgi:hypothetical protein
MPSVLRTPILRKFHNYTGDVITQGSVTIVTALTGSVPTGSTATVYSSETGSGTLSQPLSLQTDGGVSGWLEIGVYDMTTATSFGTVTSRYYSNHPRQSVLQGTALTDSQFQINDDGDTVSRITINGGGTISWSDGSNAIDANLYRLSSALLKTDSSLIIAGSANVSGTLTAGAFTATSGTITTLNAASGTFSGTISTSYGTVGTGGLVVTGNKTVSGTSFYPDGTSSAPSITFTNSSTTGLWRDTNGLNSTFLVSNRNIEKGTAVPTVTTTSTLAAGSVVGKSTNTGGLIILNPGVSQTFTLPTAANIYAEFGYIGSIFSFTLANISANSCVIATGTGITEYTTTLAFPYTLAAGVSLNMKYYVVSSTTGYIISATI